ncbi:unnamed protein product [Closterium sp. Yama58-4]|nr:unnamed protein product [Closterium sp. Yama58-4]
MAPKHKTSKIVKNAANNDADLVVPEPPYVQWMKKRQENGDRRGCIRNESMETRNGEPFGDPDNQACADLGTGTNASSDSEPEDFEAFESSDSEADSDASIESDDAALDNLASPSEVENEGHDPTTPNDNAKGKRKADRLKKKRKVWKESEMAELAAARWFTREDLKAMKGKQGAQYWKKLRRHIRKANPAWTR